MRQTDKLKVLSSENDYVKNLNSRGPIWLIFELDLATSFEIIRAQQLGRRKDMVKLTAKQILGL